jgi:hypothetical protein
MNVHFPWQKVFKGSTFDYACLYAWSMHFHAFNLSPFLEEDYNKEKNHDIKIKRFFAH